MAIRGRDILPHAAKLIRVPVGPKTKDLTGQRFGRVVAIGCVAAPDGYAETRSSFWLVRCDCGRELVSMGHRLVKLIMPKCPGCPFATKVLKLSNRRNLQGRVFGRITVIRLATIADGAPKDWGYWMARCDCSPEKTFMLIGYAVLAGTKTSCGCLLREVMGKLNFKHGMSNTPEYHAWKNMIERCHNPDNPSYKNYGERGISVCERWQNSFLHFLEDMGKRPSAAHSIDRIDNNGGYACGRCDSCRGRGLLKSNCHWTTQDVQNRNRRTNIKVVLDGIEMCIGDAADKIGIPRATVYVRIWEGMSPEEALKVTPRMSPLKPR